MRKSFNNKLSIVQDRKYRSLIDKLIMIFPPLGRVLTSIFGAQEYFMLETFRKIDSKFKIDSLHIANRYLMKGRFGGKVIPLNVNFEPDSRFLPTQEILTILSKSKVTGISNCYCRETQIKHGNVKTLNYPIRTCIHIGLGKDLQQIPYKSDNLKKVSRKEVEGLLRKCDELGMVHQLIFFPNPQFYYVVCNCDPQYCVVLNGFLNHGSPQMVKSDFIASTNENLCVDCGKCESWCHFGARIMDNDSLSFNSSRCFGCGICISKCPSNAIRLISKR